MLTEEKSPLDVSTVQVTESVVACEQCFELNTKHFKAFDFFRIQEKTEKLEQFRNMALTVQFEFGNRKK